MLLQDIKDLVEEEEKQKEQDRKCKTHEEMKAEDTRKRALETLTPEKGNKSGRISPCPHTCDM